jgi:hypothetical protein
MNAFRLPLAVLAFACACILPLVLALAQSDPPQEPHAPSTIARSVPSTRLFPSKSAGVDPIVPHNAKT